MLPRLVEQRGHLRVAEVVVVLVGARQRDRDEQRGRVRVVAVVHGREHVDALAVRGVGEEVDEVLRRHRLERDLQADRDGRLLVGGGLERDARHLARRADRDRLAGHAGLRDQLLRLGQVLRQGRRRLVGPVEDRGAVAEGTRVSQPLRHQRGALVHRVDDRLPVQRQRERLTDLDVGQRAGGRGDDHRVGRPAGSLVDLHRAALPELIQGGDAAGGVGALDGAGLQARGEVVVVRHAGERDLLDQRGRSPPVVRVGDGDDPGAGGPGLQLVRPGAHDAAGRGAVVLALLLRVGLLDDDPGHRRQLALEPVVGLVQGDRDLVLAGLLDRLDAVECLAVEAAQAGAHLTVQAVDDVGRGDRVAVPEGGLRVDGEDERFLVGSAEAGQAGHDGAVRLLQQQRLAHQRDRRVLRVVERERRVQAVDVPVDRPDGLRDRLGAGRGGGDQVRGRRDVPRAGVSGAQRPAAGGRQQRERDHSGRGD